MKLTTIVVCLKKHTTTVVSSMKTYHYSGEFHGNMPLNVPLIVVCLHQTYHYSGMFSGIFRQNLPLISGNLIETSSKLQRTCNFILYCSQRFYTFPESSNMFLDVCRYVPSCSHTICVMFLHVCHVVDH